MNKADQLDSESLMKVYGALLWSMGKIFQSAEVPRVYCGSFKDGPLARKEFEKLFEKDRNALLAHLADLPKMCGMRKVNEMVKRIRLNIVHACIIGNIKSRMPIWWGTEASQKKILLNLEDVYREVKHVYNLPEGDFPPLEEFRAALQMQDFRKFPSCSRDDLNCLKELLSVDIPIIFKSIAGVSSNKAKDTDEDGEGENKNLQAMMNFDFNTSAEYNNANFLLAFASATVVLLIAIAVAYLMDGGETLRRVLIAIKGPKE
jgi:hypothetical protein